MDREDFDQSDGATRRDADNDVQRALPHGVRQKRRDARRDQEMKRLTGQLGEMVIETTTTNATASSAHTNGKALTDKQRRRAVELYDEGKTPAEVMQELQCCYKIALKLKHDIVAQGLPKDANGKHIGFPIAGKQGGYRHSKLNDQQQVVCAQILVENPRWTIPQVAAELERRYASEQLKVSRATVWRITKKSRLQYMRALLKDPRREATAAHKLENIDFAREQLTGILKALHIFFMDETIVYLNETVSRMWGIAGTSGPVAEKSKGKTQTISVHAGLGLVPKGSQNPKRDVSQPRRLNITDPRDNSMRCNEVGEWEPLEVLPDFVLVWWLQPPQRAEGNLGRFITEEDVLDPSFTLTSAEAPYNLILDVDRFSSKGSGADGSLFQPTKKNLKKVQAFLHLCPFVVCETPADINLVKVEGVTPQSASDEEAYVVLVYDDENSNAYKFRVPLIATVSDDSFNRTIDAELTSDSMVVVSDGNKFYKVRNSAAPMVLDNKTWKALDLRSLLWWNNVEYRQVDDVGELKLAYNTRGDGEQVVVDFETMRYRFASLQAIVARAVVVSENMGSAVLLPPYRGTMEMSVPRMYFGSFGRKNKGGALQSVHGDKSMFLRYLEFVMKHYKNAYLDWVVKMLVLAWDAASAHGNVEVTSDTQSWIHSKCTKEYGIKSCVFLPVRQPDFNPVELLFSYVKSSIRRRMTAVVGQMTVERMVQLIDMAFQEVTLSMVEGWVSYGCYKVPGIELSASCQVRFDNLPIKDIASEKRDAIEALDAQLSSLQVHKLLTTPEHEMNDVVCLFPDEKRLAEKIKADGFAALTALDVDDDIVTISKPPLPEYRFEHVHEVEYDPKCWVTGDGASRVFLQSEAIEFPKNPTSTTRYTHADDGKEYRACIRLTSETMIVVKLDDDMGELAIRNVNPEFASIRPHLSALCSNDGIRLRAACWRLQRSRPVLDPAVAVMTKIIDTLYGDDGVMAQLTRANQVAEAVAESVRGYLQGAAPSGATAMEVLCFANPDVYNPRTSDEARTQLIDALKKTHYKEHVDRQHMHDPSDTLAYAIIAVAAYKRESERKTACERRTLRTLQNGVNDVDLDKQLLARLDVFRRRTNADGDANQVPIKIGTGAPTHSGAADAIDLNAFHLPPLIDVTSMRDREQRLTTRADRRVERAARQGKDVPRRWPGYPLPAPSNKPVAGRKMSFVEACYDFDIVEKDGGTIVCRFKDAFGKDAFLDPQLYDGVKYSKFKVEDGRASLTIDAKSFDESRKASNQDNEITFEFDIKGQAQLSTNSDPGPGILVVTQNSVTLNGENGSITMTEKLANRTVNVSLSRMRNHPLFDEKIGSHNLRAVENKKQRYQQNNQKKNTDGNQRKRLLQNLGRTRTGVQLYLSGKAPADANNRLVLDAQTMTLRPPKNTAWRKIVNEEDDKEYTIVDEHGHKVVIGSSQDSIGNDALQKTRRALEKDMGLILKPHKMKNTLIESVRLLDQFKDPKVFELHIVETEVTADTAKMEAIGNHLYVQGTKVYYERNDRTYPVVKRSQLKHLTENSNGKPQKWSALSNMLGFTQNDISVLKNVKK